VYGYAAWLSPTHHQESFMNRIAFRRLLIATFALLLGLVPVAPAFADAPVFSDSYFHDSFQIDGMCAFPVLVELTFVGKISTHADNNGDFTMEIGRPSPNESQFVFINLDSGKVLASRTTGIALIHLEADGTRTVTYAGMLTLVAGGGQPPLIVDAGRLTFVLEPDGSTSELLFSAGHFTIHGPGSLEAVCGPLS
jgi:hypothetical protein